MIGPVVPPAAPPSGSAAPHRSSLAVTWSVWRALMLREALTRLFATRISWAWVLFEPVFHVAYLLVLYSAVRVRSVGNLDTPVWIMVGIQTFFLFRKTADHVAGAPADNSALFAYRQVKPVDTLVARGLLEGASWLVITLLLIAILALWGHPFAPQFPLAMMGACAAMWLLGVAFGMVVSACTTLMRETRQVLHIVLRPLYMISGVMFPLGSLPADWRALLMLNPLAHGVELVRMGLSDNYQAVPETDAGYLFAWVLGLLLLGLALQLRLAHKVGAR